MKKSDRTMRVLKHILFCSGIFLLSNSALSAQANLTGVFWFDLDMNLSMPQPGQVQQLVTESQRFVLEEVSYVFHGMIYGFQVVYIPPDRFHQQEETFLVMPINMQLITPEDLDIYHTSNDGNRYYYSVRKILSDFERRNMVAWQQGDKKTLHGLGAVPYAAARSDTGSELTLEPQLLIQLRKAAIDNAIKEAIRNYFRKIIRTKPAQIRVNLALSKVPEIKYSDKVQAKVRLHMAQYTVDRYETR